MVRHTETLFAEHERQRARPMLRGQLLRRGRQRRTKRFDRRRVRRQKRNLLAPFASLDGIEPFHGLGKTRMGREAIDGVGGDDRHAAGV